MDRSLLLPGRTNPGASLGAPLGSFHDALPLVAADLMITAARRLLVSGVFTLRFYSYLILAVSGVVRRHKF
jgi:hypothetical protein